MCDMSEQLISRRPLTSSSRDQAFHVTTAATDRVLSALRLRTNVIATGSAGSGKTTLARFIEANWSDVLFVSAEQFVSIDELVLGIARRITSGVSFSQSLTHLLKRLDALDDEDLPACQSWMVDCLGLLRHQLGEGSYWCTDVERATQRHLDPESSHRQSTANNRRRSLAACGRVLIAIQQLEAEQGTHVHSSGTITGALRHEPHALRRPQQSHGGSANDPSSELSVGAIRDALDARSASVRALRLIVVDGATEDQLRVFFGRFRDAVWDLPVHWMVTSRSRPAPPADAFFDQVVELEPWSEQDIVKLISKRSPDTPGDWIAALANQIAPATPTEALLALQEFLMADNIQDLLVVLRDEKERLLAAPDRLIDLYRAVRLLGPVSASDERLINAVGVSRSRLTHGLKELEELRLVHSDRYGRKVLYDSWASAFLRANDKPVDEQ